jgi:branched-chain amino acid transport system permease protein
MVLRGAKQNARRINAIGFRSERYQLSAYVLSAIMCGIAGMLLANLTAFASPSNLSWIVSGDLIVMIVLGGIGSVFGPVLGAVVFLGLEEVLKSLTEYWPAIFGVAIVLVALLGKAGIIGLLESMSRNKAEPAPPDAATSQLRAKPAGEQA